MEIPRPPDIKVEHIMTKEVFSITLGMTIREAIRLMTSHRISGAPVVDNARNVVSVMTEGDALKIAASAGLDKTVMKIIERLPKTQDLVTARASDSFADVYKLFLQHSFHRILVVDGSGKLTGIVSRANVLMLLVEGPAAAAAGA